MYHSVLPLVGWTVLLGVFLLAWFKGGAAERWGATLKVGTSAMALAVHVLFHANAISVALLTADGLLALGFLVLAIRYASLWIGAAMLLQGVQFSLHAWYLVIERPHDRMYSVINNLDTFAVIGCILVGTLIAWRRREQAVQTA